MLSLSLAEMEKVTVKNTTSFKCSPLKSMDVCKVKVILSFFTHSLKHAISAVEFELQVFLHGNAQKKLCAMVHFNKLEKLLGL